MDSIANVITPVISLTFNPAVITCAFIHVGIPGERRTDGSRSHTRKVMLHNSSPPKHWSNKIHSQEVARSSIDCVCDENTTINVDSHRERLFQMVFEMRSLPKVDPLSQRQCRNCMTNTVNAKLPIRWRRSRNSSPIKNSTVIPTAGVIPEMFNGGGRLIVDNAYASYSPTNVHKSVSDNGARNIQRPFIS